MKILFFSHYYWPEGNAPASRVTALTKAWVAAGHEVTVVTCVPNVPNGVVYDGYKNRLFSREMIDGVRVVRVWTYIAPNKGTVRRIINFVSYMLSAILTGLFLKTDMVIATSPQFFCGWAGLIVSKIRRKPFVLEIRDIWPESIIAVGANLPARAIRVLEWLELKMYVAADHIVTVGEGYRAKLMEKGVPSDKMSIIMNGVDKELFVSRPYPTEIAEKWNLGGKYVCSYIGTIGMACGLNTVLQAAQKLKQSGENDVVFLLVGDGAQRESLERRAQELALENVVFTGRQPKESMPDYLAVSDCCLVHLIKSDLFKTVMPSKIFEAAGMKRPVIMGVDGPAKDIVEKAGAGVMMEPENDDELLKCIRYLKDHPEESKQMGKSGCRYITSHFDRQQLADEYLCILSALKKVPMVGTFQKKE